MLLIEEIQSQAASMDAPVDVSQTTLEGKYFYSELLFNKMSFLLHRKDGENCLASAEELASAKQELMKEEQVSYRYTFQQQLEHHINFILSNRNHELH